MKKKMLEPFAKVLSSHRIILASGSPRRREILKTALPSLEIEVIPSQAEENLDRTLQKYREKPWLYAQDTAQLKAKGVMEAELEKSTEGKDYDF